jgi:hypothetical protein
MQFYCYIKEPCNTKYTLKSAKASGAFRYLCTLVSQALLTFLIYLKQMKKIMIAVTLFAAALNIVSCNPKELLKPLIDPNFVIIDGDTIKTNKTKDFEKFKSKHSFSKIEMILGDTIVLYKQPKLHSKPGKQPNLTNIKNNIDANLKGKPLRYVAIGGSTAAGYRDGGWFNEGIATSYPNLISIQLGIQNFRQPYFDVNEYNGFGRRVETKFNPTNGPVKKFKEANNNLAVTDFETFKMKPFIGQIDNFAIPMVSNNTFNSRQSKYGYFLNDFVTSSNASLKRVVENGDLYSKIFDKNDKFDFLTIDFCTNDVFEYGLGLKNIFQDDGSYLIYSTEKIINQKPEEYGANKNFPQINEFISPSLKLARTIESEGVKKVVLLNQPPPEVLYVRNYLPISLFKKYFGSNKDVFIKSHTGVVSHYDINNYKFFTPNSEIDSLLSNVVMRNPCLIINYSLLCQIILIYFIMLILK